MMQSNFQSERFDRNISKDEYFDKNITSSKHITSEPIVSKQVTTTVITSEPIVHKHHITSEPIAHKHLAHEPIVDKHTSTEDSLDKHAKKEKFDPILSRDEYFDKNRVLPADKFPERFMADKKPFANPTYSGVSAGAIGGDYVRPLNQHLVNHAAYNQAPYYAEERFSEPWGRSSIPMSYSKPMRYTGHEDPSFVDKSWSKHQGHHSHHSSHMPTHMSYEDPSSMTDKKAKNWREQQFISERKNMAVGQPGWSTPTKPNKEITKKGLPDDREYFNPTFLRPNSYHNSVKPSDRVIGAATDLFTSMGLKAKPVDFNSHDSFVNDPSEIVEALIKVQRVNPRTGVAESFHEEGLTTTLRIHRRMLRDHGLKKNDEGILAFMKRKAFDLDSIIDFNTRNAIKRSIGLGPLDNIKLELLPHSTFSTGHSQHQVGQVFRRNPIDQNRSFADYNTYERDYHRERMPIGRSAFVGGAVDGAWNERKSYDHHESRHWNDTEYEQKKPGVVKRTIEGIKASLHGHKDDDVVEGGYEHGMERRPYEFRDHTYGRRTEGYGDRNVGSWEGEGVEHKKPSKVKEAIEGIKCAVQGPKYHLKHPEINPSNDDHVMGGHGWSDNKWSNRGTVNQHPVSFEDRNWGYKSERPYYSNNQEWNYGNRSQGDFYDKGYVERPNYNDRGFSQRTEEQYYRY